MRYQQILGSCCNESRTSTCDSTQRTGRFLIQRMRQQEEDSSSLQTRICDVPLERSSTRFIQDCLGASLRNSATVREIETGQMAVWGLGLWMLQWGGGCRQHPTWDLGDATRVEPYRAGYLLSVLLCRLQVYGLLQNLNPREPRINTIKSLIKDN